MGWIQKGYNILSHSVYQNRLTDHLPNPLSVPFMSYDARVKKRHPPRKRDECHFFACYFESYFEKAAER